MAKILKTLGKIPASLGIPIAIILFVAILLLIAVDWETSIGVSIGGCFVYSMIWYWFLKPGNKDMI